MKAVRFHTFGDADLLRFEEAPRPAPGSTDVLLQIKAAALNHLDVWVRRGDRERRIPLPHIPGSDGAGVVAEVGTSIDYLKPGDAVLVSPGLSCGRCTMCLRGQDNLCSAYHAVGTLEDGTYAEYVKIPAVNAVRIPDGMNFQQAAAVPLVFLTAWHMLVTLARVRPEETVLVHGAGSGVGSAAVQIARLLSARVITTVGTNDKVGKARDLGADEVINYREQDFVQQVRALTGKQGVDVVFEHIGGQIFEKSLTIMRKGGRLVTCGATTDYAGKVDLRYLYSRQLSVLGSYMGTKAELPEVLKFFESGRLKAVIDRVFPLAQAADAHRYMEERKNFGKIVLSM